MLRFYICGPMTGLPEFNYPAFNKAAMTLRINYGDIVEFINPVELDAAEGVEPEDTTSDFVYKEVLARDLRQIMDVHGLVILPGWQSSRGANAEIALARALGKHLFLYRGNDTPEPFDDVSAENTGQSGESRTIGDLLFDETTKYIEGPTGGRKGQKICRYDLIPPEPEAELAAAYGIGAEKYDDDNYLKGYNWRSSYGAMRRHQSRWFMGEDYDPETGIHHLALSAWHCFTMMTFQARGIGQDDRAGKR